MAEDEQYEYHLDYVDHALYDESSDYGAHGTQQESHNLVQSQAEIAYDPYNPAMNSFESQTEL